MFISATTTANFSVFNIDINLLIPTHLEKWGYNFFSLALLASHVLYPSLFTIGGQQEEDHVISRLLKTTTKTRE